MLDWLLYLFFGSVTPNCQADTLHELTACDSSQVEVYTGGGGGDPTDDDDNGSNQQN